MVEEPEKKKRRDMGWVAGIAGAVSLVGTVAVLIKLLEALKMGMATAVSGLVTVEKFDVTSVKPIMHPYTTYGVFQSDPGRHLVASTTIGEPFNSFCVDMFNGRGSQVEVELVLNGETVAVETVDPWSSKRTCHVGVGNLEVYASSSDSINVHYYIYGTFYVNSEEYVHLFSYEFKVEDVIRPARYVKELSKYIDLGVSVNRGEGVKVMVNGVELDPDTRVPITEDSVTVHVKGSGFVVLNIWLVVERLVLDTGGFAVFRYTLDEQGGYTEYPVIFAREDDRCYNCLYYDRQVVLANGPRGALVLVRVGDKELEARLAEQLRLCPDLCYE